MSRIKVCYIVSTFPRNERDPEVPWLVECVRRLRDRGVEIKVFAPSFKGLGDHVIFGIPVHRFRYFFRRWETLTHDEGAPNKIMARPLYKYLAFPYVLFGILDAIQFFRRESFDILHVHWPFPHGLFGMIGSRICQARVILNFHGAELLLCRKYPIVRHFLRFFLRNADRTIANSSFTRDKIVEVERRPVEVIPFGATLEERRAIEPKGPVKTILFVGRLVERKGVAYLIRAMPRVLEKVRAQLVIVGEGYRREALEQLIAEERLDEAVKLTGKVSDEAKRGWYETCDVFVLPSIVDSKGDTEGLGMVLLEALGYRKPVVASRVGGIPDIVLDGEMGLLVPEKDPEALGEAIVSVLTDEHLAQRLGTRGHQYAKERFAWERIVNEIVGMYESVAEAKR